MTLDAWITAKLTSGSPLPFPALGVRWYLLTAPQMVTKPYAVFQQVGENPIAIQENTETLDLRNRHYQFALYGPDASVLHATARGLIRLMLGVREFGAGVRCVRFLTQHDSWFEAEKVAGVVVELEFSESLEA